MESEIMKAVELYLANYFNGIELAPALFYETNKAIRFEISESIAHDEPDFLKQAFYRSITLFEAVFGDEDDIILVTDVHTNNDFLRAKPLHVYSKYVKRKDLLYKLRFSTVPNLYGDEEELVTHRFSLSCQKRDVRYKQLLKAICYEDFADPTTILKHNPESGYDIFFINQSKNIIYHLYDDRGCDIIASDKESIRFLYEQYTDWILDYDKQEVDEDFSLNNYS
ncbi:hypothetical protein CSV77_06995 [Sporosarcina sp. P16b]|nr:hypothetical protein CSV77_06995 [Sporosarcina sp. P16b]